MSEIYLTKIERKTIFTKSLIFVLIMFIISDLTVTGPFWFNFIPWMYILGTVGSLKKIDSVLMGVIGTFTAFTSSVIMHAEINMDCIWPTIIGLVTLVLGIVTGKILYEFVLEHRLVKYIRRRKKTGYIIAAIAMFIASYLMVASYSGNIVSYVKSRNSLDAYITKTYGTEDFDVIKVKYVKDAPGKYTYKVKMDGQEVVFVPVSVGVFKDANQQTRYMALRLKLARELESDLLNVMDKYPHIEGAMVYFDLEYNSVAINPDTVVCKFKYTMKSEQDAKVVYGEIANCIKELQTIKESQKIIITVNDNTLQISSDKLNELTADYITAGFEIEEIIE